MFILILGVPGVLLTVAGAPALANLYMAIGMLVYFANMFLEELTGYTIGDAMRSCNQLVNHSDE